MLTLDDDSVMGDGLNALSNQLFKTFGRRRSSIVLFLVKIYYFFLIGERVRPNRGEAEEEEENF